jgi:hypothetical protein
MNFSVGGPVPGDICTFPSGSTTTFGKPLPIVNHAFSSSSGGMTLNGTFSGVQMASGTFRIKSFPPYSCDSGSISWTARTTASPAGSEECKSATAAVDNARTRVKAAARRLKAARAKLRRAKSVAAKRKARARLRRAKSALVAAKKAKGQAEQAAEPVCG